MYNAHVVDLGYSQLLSRDIIIVISLWVLSKQQAFKIGRTLLKELIFKKTELSREAFDTYLG